MKNTINKFILGIGIVFSLAAFSSCSKDEDMIMNDTNAANAQTAQPFLKGASADRLLAIQSATDDGVNVTDKYDDFTFNLLSSVGSTSSGSGEVKVWNDILTETGTWSSTAAGRITFSFPLTRLPDLAFFNKEWQIVNNSSEVLQLQAANGENDAVSFVRKSETEQ